MATIVNPDHRPQMATVRSGVMQKAIYEGECRKEVAYPEVGKYVSAEAFVVKVLDHHVEAAKHNLKGAQIVVAGGYGMGSKEGFDMLFDLAKVLHDVLLSMPVSATMTVRLVRQVSPSTRRCTSPAASPVRFSTSPACRTPASSSL